MVTESDDDDEADDTPGREPPPPIKSGKVKLPGIRPRLENRRGE